MARPTLDLTDLILPYREFLCSFELRQIWHGSLREDKQTARCQVLSTAALGRSNGTGFQYNSGNWFQFLCYTCSTTPTALQELC
jgi:hypothetical protein